MSAADAVTDSLQNLRDRFIGVRDGKPPTTSPSWPSRTRTPSVSRW